MGSIRFFNDITWREHVVHNNLQPPVAPPLLSPSLPMVQEVTGPHKPAAVRQGISCVRYHPRVTPSGLIPPMTGENQSEANLVLHIL